MFCYPEQSQQPQPDASVPLELSCSLQSLKHVWAPDTRGLISVICTISADIELMSLSSSWLDQPWPMPSQFPLRFWSDIFLSPITLKSLQATPWLCSRINKMWCLVTGLPLKWVLQGIRTPQSYEIIETRRNRYFLLKTSLACIKMRKPEPYPSKPKFQIHIS